MWRRPYPAEFLLGRGRGVLKSEMSAPDRHFKINFVSGDTCNIGYYGGKKI
jgi:hypothetical protein